MNILVLLKKLLFNEKNNTIEETVTMINLEQLYLINSSSNKDMCEYYLSALNTILPTYDINTPLRLAHFLAQILHESGHFRYKSENLNYSASALRAVFGKYFKSDEQANKYARQPEKIANLVYAGRMGNGDEASGDGWKYRGRGLIQLTGKENYTKCGDYVGLDLVNSPDLLINTPEASIAAACWYWETRNLNIYADKDDILTITKKINGGTNGLADRKEILTLAKQVLL